jgi:hypothetical protein
VLAFLLNNISGLLLHNISGLAMVSSKVENFCDRGQINFCDQRFRVFRAPKLRDFFKHFTPLTCHLVQRGQPLRDPHVSHANLAQNLQLVLFLEGRLSAGRDFQGVLGL